MNGNFLYERILQESLVTALGDTPAVLIHGPRQCGKSTLALHVGEALGYRYVTFDDDTVRASARVDPVGFVAALPERTILDEVQRAPDLFTALKVAIDRDRRPGRFILTGSSNVLLLPQLADSLAGRMEVLRLHPLAQVEMAGSRPHFIEALFARRFSGAPAARLGGELIARIVAGGYPAAIARTVPARRAAWYRDYITTLVQRDVRDLARISALDALPRLLEMAAGQTARLINVADLAAPFQLSRPTIRDYVTLLTNLFLLDQLPAWHSNRLSRLVKTPKLHMGDTGLACALLGLNDAVLEADRTLLGQLLETFVYQELHRQAGADDGSLKFHHLRDKDGVEVDIVIERSGRGIAGVEVKAAASVTSSDFNGLRKLQRTTGDRFAAGVVLYDGEATLSFGERLYALPLRLLWEESAGTRE